MKHRRFNAIMPYVNEAWGARVLGMDHNFGKGIDLKGEKCDIEIKFTLLDSAGKYPYSWTVQNHQLKYGAKKRAYWGLGTYKLSVDVSSIRTTDEQRLEELVIERELWLIPWDWMKQYKPNKVTGHTDHSSWKNVFRYPKFNMLPKTTQTAHVEKGIVHITSGVNPEDICIKEIKKVA
jgi:hypothetical protein